MCLDTVKGVLIYLNIYISIYIYYMFVLIPIVMILSEGNLEAKLPTIWTVGKAEVGRVREEKRRRDKVREEKK